MSANPISGPITTPSSAPSTWMSQLLRAADTNGDGQISVTEFETFLSGLLQQLSGTTSSSAHPGTLITTADPAAAPAPELIEPATWTDNDDPYGATFAGFSPQDHTQLSIADLSNPRNAKYAAYDYLLSNRVDPNTAWAPGAADALNRQLGAHVFDAVGDQKLSFGGEVIHSAQNGHGMLSGTYNPSATGEFFWGEA